MADRLRAIVDDATAADSTLEAELVGELATGGDVSEALSRARASVVFAFQPKSF